MLTRNAFLKQVFLATTKWTKECEPLAIRNEAELSNVYWASLVSRGFQVRRLSEEPGSVDRAYRSPDLLAELVQAIGFT